MAARRRWVLVGVAALACSVAWVPSAQTVQPAKFSCSGGSHPPGPPRDRTVAPYAGEPDDLRPYSKFAEPYFRHYLVPNIYSGAGRDLPDPDLRSLDEIRIGFLAPLDKSSDSVLGQRMLQGAQLAIEASNAAGGYGGKPFRLMIHNDYDNWQAGQVYGAERPTDPTIWGSPSNEAVKMVYDEHVWAIFGSISSESTHIILRTALRAEIPIVNSASTDPTIPETYIPWYWTDLQDDRVQNQVLARHIFGELGLKRVAILRVNNRYGRFGVAKFRDAARRLGHPVVIEQKFRPGDSDFRHQLKAIEESRADAVLLWTDQLPAAGILRQMREAGMKQRVFGSYRVIGQDLLREAGASAEGLEAVFPFDPERSDPKWQRFQADYQARFHEPPEAFAALAYDAMGALLQSICAAGLNRARIHDALANLETYDGVTGPMIFDPNSKNVAPMYLGVVHDGKISYRRASVEKLPVAASKAPGAATPEIPYARIAEEPGGFTGPPTADRPELRLAVFGANAEAAVTSAEVQDVLRANSGQAISLIPVVSNVSWGKASTALVSALMDQHAMGIIALDRDSAHLAEQLALKAFVPVLALSDDHALTSANVPWIFRLSSRARLDQALRCFLAAETLVGPNPESLRQALSSGQSFAGFRFSKQGEPQPEAAKNILSN